MDIHYDELNERILRDIKNVFLLKPYCDEFDILPVHESMKNKSPVIHIQNKLALEDWCVKSLYVYVYNKFLKWRLQKTNVDLDTLLLWTSVILLVNPEIELAWNVRKELWCKANSNNWQLSTELKFSLLVLSRKPNSSSAFSHRKWILSRLLQEKNKNFEQEIIEQEFLVCSRMALLYANNYFAWSHRSWIIQELLFNCLKSVSEELSRTTQWVTTHISDHSGFYYRQFLLSCYRIFAVEHSSSEKLKSCPFHSSMSRNEDINCFSPTKIEERMLQLTKEIEREVIFLSDLQRTYPGHETLWYHRRYLLHEIRKIQLNDVLFSFKYKSSDNAFQNKRHKCELRLSTKWDTVNEEEFLNQCISVSVNDKWEHTLISRHLSWLNKELKWPVNVKFS